MGLNGIVPPGVVTGDNLLTLMEYCKKHGVALPGTVPLSLNLAKLGIQHDTCCYPCRQRCGSGSAWILNFCQQKVKEHVNKTVNSGLFVLLDSSIE